MQFCFCSSLMFWASSISELSFVKFSTSMAQVTCQLLGVILEESSPEELQVLPVLHGLIKSSFLKSFGLMSVLIFVAEASNCKTISARGAAWDHKMLWSLSHGKGAGWWKRSKALTSLYSIILLSIFSFIFYFYAI